MSDDFKFYESFTNSENLQTFDEISSELFENPTPETVIDYSFIEREHPKYANGTSKKRKIEEISENWSELSNCSEKFYLENEAENEAKTYHNLTPVNHSEELLWQNEVELFPFEDKCDQLVREIEQIGSEIGEEINFDGKNDAKMDQKGKKQQSDAKVQHKKNKNCQNSQLSSNLTQKPSNFTQNPSNFTQKPSKLSQKSSNVSNLNQKAKNLAQNIQNGNKKLLSKSKSFKSDAKNLQAKENGGIIRNYQSEPLNGQNGGKFEQNFHLKTQNYQIEARNQGNGSKNLQNGGLKYQNGGQNYQNHSKFHQNASQNFQNGGQNNLKAHQNQPDWQYHNYLQQQSHFGFVPHQYSNIAHNFFPAPPQEPVKPLAPPTAIIYTQEQKTLTCEICVRTFKTTSNLVRHFNSKTHQNKLEIKKNSFKDYKMSPLTDISEEERALLWQIDDEIYEFLQDLEIEKKKTTAVGSFPTPPLTPLPLN